MILLFLLSSCAYPDIDTVPDFKDVIITKEDSIELCLMNIPYKKLKYYIDWAEGYVKHSPYLFIYYDLATAYQAMDDKEKAWEIYRYAQYLYPGAKWRDELNSKGN